MIKPASGRTFEYTPREGSKAGMDRRPPKLLTDAVNFLFNLLYDRAILILTISLILAIIFYVIGQVEATPLTQNFTG